MPSIDAGITPESAKDFSKAIRSLERNTKKNAEQITVKATQELVRSLRARSKGPRATKTAPAYQKKHKVIPNPELKAWKAKPAGQRRGRGPAPFLIVKLRQGGHRPHHKPSRIGAKDPKREIEFAGAMKRSWGQMLAKLGSSGGIQPFRFKRDPTAVAKRIYGIKPEIVIHNKLPYITDDRPNIARDSLTAAAKSIQAQLRKREELIAAKFNRSIRTG